VSYPVGTKELAAFKSIDSNGDMRIGMEEALAFLEKASKLNEERKQDDSWFSDIDVDGDGWISPWEFDPDISVELVDKDAKINPQ